MIVELSLDEIEALLVSIEYSKLDVREARDSPSSVRQENRSKLEAVATKLREARKKSKM